MTSIATQTRTASASATVTLPPGTTPSVTAAASAQPAVANEFPMNGGDAQRTCVSVWTGPPAAPTRAPGVFIAGADSLGAMAVDAAGTAYVAYFDGTLYAFAFDLRR